MDHSAGVSELIGAVLMIMIVVVAVSLIAVMLMSQQAPQKIPNINFMTGTNAAGNLLYLYHNGGDTLTSGEFAVVLDGQVQRTDYSISDGSRNWSVGTNLVLSIDPTAPPKTVAIIYTSGGSGDILLRSGSSSVAALSQNIKPDATPMVSEGSSCSDYICNDVANIINSSHFIEAIKQNVSSTSINFYKNSLSPTGVQTGAPTGRLRSGSYLELKVTDGTGKSQIVYQPQGKSDVLLTLNNTDRVRVTINASSPNFIIFGIAPQIWEMAVTNADLTITRSGGVSTISEQGVNISHTWIANYIVYDSTLEIDTAGNSITTLTVNNTRIVPPSGYGGTITISAIKPLPVGLFLVFVDNSQGGTVYLVNTADQICMDTSCGPFGIVM